jgi:hypothetical protein
MADGGSRCDQGLWLIKLGARVCSHSTTSQSEDLNQSSVAAIAMPAA